VSDAGARGGICAEVRDPATAVLRISGDLDHAARDDATAALRWLEGAAPRVAVIDLQQVTFMDCGGLRFLIEAQERAGAGGWRLLVVPPPPPADRVLEITGLLEAFTSGPSPLDHGAD
jgi:anti-anti-sigma factor